MCPWVEMFKDRVELPNKKQIDYYKVETPISAMIVPVTGDNQLVLTKQYRYPTDEFSIEFPAGRTDDKSSIATARAELEEEVGYKAKNIQKIGEFVPWNGIGTEVCHVYLATELSKTKQKLDEAEFIEIFQSSIADFAKMINKGQIRCGMTLAAWTLAQRYLYK